MGVPARVVFAAATSAALLLVNQASAQAQQRQTIRAGRMCDACLIQLEWIATLKGDHVFGEPLAMSRLPNGDLLVSYFPIGDGVYQFDSQGAYRRTWAKSGAGPGEVRSVTSLALLSSDSVAVFDGGLGRVTIYTVDGRAARSFAFPARVNAAVELSDGRLVVNADIPTPELIGLPLHVIDRDGHIVRSFGGLQGGVYRPDFPYQSLRVLAVDGTDGVWGAGRTAYEVSKYGTDGLAAKTLVRDVEWFVPYLHKRPVNPDTPLDSWLRGIRALRGGEVLVVVNVPQEGWQDNLGSPTRNQSGDVAYLDIAVDRVFDTVLEIVDTETLQVVAAGRHEAYLSLVLDSEHFASYRQDASGMPFIDVWRLRTGPRRQQ